MKLKGAKFHEVLSFYKELKLIKDSEIKEVLAMFQKDYPYAQALNEADSISSSHQGR